MKTLVVGTAQWGMNYGVTNAHGRVSEDTLESLVAILQSSKIGFLDTAPTYGDAEMRIGEFREQFQIQTKIAGSGQTRQGLKRTLKKSLTDLRIDNLHSILVHDWHLLTIDERENISQFLDEMKHLGLVSNIGISAYDVEDLNSAVSFFRTIDIAQVPVNTLDQRLFETPFIEMIRNGGGLIQARSIFLQGVLVGKPIDMKSLEHESVSRFHQAADQHGRSNIEFALDYIKSQSWIDEVIVAPTSVRELQEICYAWDSPSPTGVDWASLASTDLDLIDPRRWA